MAINHPVSSRKHISFFIFNKISLGYKKFFQSRFKYLNLFRLKTFYKIAAKKMDRKTARYYFIIETNDKIRFIRRADELAKDRTVLFNMPKDDIYDVLYTHGRESLLNERDELSLAKHHNTQGSTK